MLMYGRQIREQRKQDLEKHIAEYNAELRKLNPDLDEVELETEDVNGQDGGAAEETLDRAAEVEGEDEFVDEDKYTTVTVEAMGESASEGSDEDGDAKGSHSAAPMGDMAEVGAAKKKRIWTKEPPAADGRPKQKKKKKFRYETKAERQETRRKQKKQSRAAKAKREKGKGEG
jgi:ribosomal RNA-processing protein 17